MGRGDTRHTESHRLGEEAASKLASSEPGEEPWLKEENMVVVLGR